MNILQKTLAGVSAAMLVASPVMAQAQVDRTAAPAQEGENVFGGNLILSLTLIAAVIAGVIVIASNDDDQPASP